MRRILESWSTGQWLLTGSVALAFLAVIVVWWLIAGAGPRRRRGIRQARRLLKQGNWHDAAGEATRLRGIGHPGSSWQTEFDRLEGEALKVGAAEALAAGDYDGSLTYSLQAARLLGENPLEPRMRVQGAILEEARRRLSGSAWSESAPIVELLEHARRVQSPCREASFWEAICALRDGAIERAIDHLHVARTGVERNVRDEAFDDRGPPPSPILEPPLYLGAILLRQGKAKEALRYFTEANRLDPSCPLVPLHLGCGMVAAGGDLGLAVRTLQKALGPKGLAAWKDRPAAFWAEVYPKNRSYVVELAIKYPFHCPLWGETPAVLVRQGQLALAQALQRQGQNQEAVDLFTNVLKEGAPSLPVLRGLGLAQARLGQFDEAYKSLRLAYDLEDPKDRLTAGYLALCAVKATPANVHDVPTNLAWAMQTVTPFSSPGDAEWVGVISEIFSAARQANLPLSLDDQLHLCEHLASIHATDPSAAAAYRRIFEDHPGIVRPEYAWLYSQALAAHPEIDDASLSLFELALHDRPAAVAFFEQQGWNLETVERAYLERVALARPGKIPAVFGDDGARHVESLLLDGSREAEAAGQFEQARSFVETFSRLVPHHPAALDRLASLHFRAGRIAQSLAALAHWLQKAPGDPLPLVRLGLLRGSMGDVAEAIRLLEQARDRAVGVDRSTIALAAAKLAIQHAVRDPNAIDDAGVPILTSGSTSSLAPDAALASSQANLERALADDPTRAEAIALLGAVLWLRNDRPALQTLAPRCVPLTSDDPRHHYFAALVLFAAERWTDVVDACRSVARLVADQNGALGALAIEAAYLEGIAHVERGDAASAAAALEKPAATEDHPASLFARGLLGAMLLEQGQFEAATNWWQKLPAPERSAWKIGEVLGGVQMLAALQAFESGQFEAAADKFRLAGKLGCRDRRLGGFLLASLVKAGKQAVFGA